MSLFSEKHNLHLNDFSPVCVCSCLVKYPFLANLFTQNVHLNGFFPVCVRTYMVKAPFWKNLITQNLHLKGFLQYAFVHCILQQIFFHKVYIEMVSLQYVYAPVK